MPRRAKPTKPKVDAKRAISREVLKSEWPTSRIWCDVLLKSLPKVGQNRPLYSTLSGKNTPDIVAESASGSLYGGFSSA